MGTFGPPMDESPASAGGESGEDDEDDDENFLEEEELAGLLLGDRSGHSAEEALQPFTASTAVLEAQQWEFQKCLGNYMQSQELDAKLQRFSARAESGRKFGLRAHGG
eukprot:symbB.v1.2.038952.t1/scaffold6253.1/size19614/3